MAIMTEEKPLLRSTNGIHLPKYAVIVAAARNWNYMSGFTAARNVGLSMTGIIMQRSIS